MDVTLKVFGWGGRGGVNVLDRMLTKNPAIDWLLHIIYLNHTNSNVLFSQTLDQKIQPSLRRNSNFH